MQLLIATLSLLVALTCAADVDESLRALNERLASSSAKMEALRAAATASAELPKAAAAASSHTSVLGRKRAAATLAEAEASGCADGSTLDTDRDGHLDCFDACPNDFRKTRPGVCGCGVADVDSDLDGRADCVDRCPLDAHKSDAGLCGCGAADTGCGCNVEPVRVGDCSHVVGVAGGALSDGATYDVFAPDGGVGARVVLPAGALSERAGEQLVLKLVAPRVGSAETQQWHSAALDISLLAPPRAAPRERAQNGYLLERAATVCLAPESELAVRGLCLGFFDVKTEAFKCFESELVYSDGLACARVPLLARVQLVRQSRQTALAPYVKSVAPALCPASGRCELVVSGGNFDRGVLTRIAVGGQPIDVDSCRYSATELRCDAIPAGRGANLALDLAFTNHVAQDMSFDVHVANALSYANARIFEVTQSADRIVVKGENFGPAGALADGAILVDGAPCVDARVDEHDAQLSCAVPSHVLEKRRIFFDHDGDASDSSDSSDDDDHHHHRRHHHSRHHHTVTMRMHDDAEPVTSNAAHWTPACAAGESTCADNSCVADNEFCPSCPSGWSQCPLATPLQAGGRCHSLSWQQLHKADVFDLTLDGSLARLPIGADAYFGLAAGAAGLGGKQCASFGMPVHADGFASHVYNITVGSWWRGAARLEVRPFNMSEIGDAYGYCFARYAGDHWECVDESLEIGELSGENLVLGDVPLHAGENLFALIVDNCPHVENPLQSDEDGNGVGDACDAPAEVAESCRDKQSANVKYLQKVLEGVAFDVDEQPCPYATDKQVGVCNPQGAIFKKHVAAWAGPARPLPLTAPYEVSAKGSRKSFPNRQGINAAPNSVRNAQNE